jgi:hypothetical protein
MSVSLYLYISVSLYLCVSLSLYLCMSGAQYIKKAKTPQFQELMDRWVGERLLQQWRGTFAEYSPKTGVRMLTQASDLPFDPTSVTSKDARFVAVPTMSALCDRLVEGEGINCNFGRRISVAPTSQTSQTGTGKTGTGAGTGETGRWNVMDAATGEKLQEVDWIISTDR